MNKSTIELVRYPKHIQGYALASPPIEISETNQLNAIVKWSNEYSVPMMARVAGVKKRTIYKHVLRREEENQNGEVYKYFSYGREISKGEWERKKDSGKVGEAYACYYCDLVYYLDIYWQ